MDGILPQDINGQRDVYEWEEEGVGSCRQTGGCVSLITNGTSPSESSFGDASTDGKDVFFLTYSQLVPQDTDGLIDVYDAREGGGFPVTTPVVSPSCNGEDCKQPLSEAPVFGAPATTTLFGAGNISAPTPNPVTKHRHPSKRHKRKRHRTTKHKSKRARHSRRERR
jgi:hypothetical protein